MNEVDQIFENYTIKEIKTRHVESRFEIEKKKEELRFLVSERYRDIIDAADNIFDMKIYTDKINDSLKKMNQIHSRWDYLQSKSDISNEGENLKKQDLTNKTHLAAQIKLMFNMSDLIWNSLEKSEFVNAALLFCVCRNISIHSKLASEKYVYEDVDAQLILSRQWSSLSNLEGTIWLICQRYLKSRNIVKENKKILECLIAIMLVKGGNLEDMLNEYLDSNKIIIEECFSTNKSSVIRTDHQLIEVIQTIVDTIKIVYYLFINNSIITELKNISEITVKRMDCTRDERIYRFLPEQIALFKPAHNLYQNNNGPLKSELVANKITDWLNKIRNENERKFESSFSHLISMKSAHETYSELISILNIDFSKLCEASNQTALSNLFVDIHKQNTSHWLSLIYRVYNNKLKLIIDDKFKSYFDEWKISINKVLSTISDLQDNNEFDNSQFLEFIWQNSIKDVQFNPELQFPTFSLSTNDINQEGSFVFNSINQHLSHYFNIGTSYSGKNCNFEPLLVKIKAIRSEIFQSTKSLNDKFLEMVSEMIDFITDHVKIIWPILQASIVSMFNDAKDWTSSQICDNNPFEFNYTIPQDFGSLINNSSNNSIFCSKNQFKNLILAQSLKSLCEFTPCLQACVMTNSYLDKINAISSISTDKSTTTNTGNKKRNKLWRLPFLPSKRIQQIPELESIMWKLWQDIIQPLNECCANFTNKSFCNDFVAYLVNKFILTYKYGQLNPDHCNHIVTKWDIVKVSSTVNTTSSVCLQVPAQASWPLHTLLLQLCSCLGNSTGGYTLPKYCQITIRHQLLLTLIEQIKEQILPCQQLIALQMIFDLRFLLEVTGASKSDLQKNLHDGLKSILNELETSIDPFDYSMMQDSLQQNLTQSISKNYALYTVLYSSTNNASLGPSGTGGKIFRTNNTQESSSSHNLLDLAGSNSITTTSGSNSTIRFGLLPVVGLAGNVTKNKLPSKNESTPSSNHNIEPLESKPVVVSTKLNDPDPDSPNNKLKRSRGSTNSLINRFGSKWF